MKRIFLFTIILLLSAPAAYSQENSLARDTLAFRTYLSDNIGTCLDAQVLIKTYRRLAMRHDKGEKVGSEAQPPAAGYRTPQPSTYPDERASVVLYGDVNVGDWYPTGNIYGHMDNAKLPDSLRTEIKEAFDAYHGLHRWRTGYEKDNFIPHRKMYPKVNMKEKKERLIRDLQKFDSLSSHKPTFFATIHSVYGGDIRRYVEDLHKKSILGSRRKLTWFLRFPTAKKLQNDLSVQFTIGLKLYDLWIERVRRGEISEPEAVSETPLNE